MERRKNEETILNKINNMMYPEDTPHQNQRKRSYTAVLGRGMTNINNVLPQEGQEDHLMVETLHNYRPKGI